MVCKKDKLLEKVKRSKHNLRFEEIETLLKQCGWVFSHQIGSHRIWHSPTRYRISLQSNKGKAKSYQIQQFLTQYKKETESE